MGRIASSEKRPAVFGHVRLRAVAKARPPLLRVLGAVEDGIDDDGVSRRFVENLVWKPTKEGTSELVHGDWKKVRMPLDGEDTRLGASEEVLAKPRLAALIPIVGLRNIVVSLLGVADALNHAAPEPAA